MWDLQRPSFCGMIKALHDPIGGMIFDAVVRYLIRQNQQNHSLLTLIKNEQSNPSHLHKTMDEGIQEDLMCTHNDSNISQSIIPDFLRAPMVYAVVARQLYRLEKGKLSGDDLVLLLDKSDSRAEKPHKLYHRSVIGSLERFHIVKTFSGEHRSSSYAILNTALQIQLG